MSCNLHTGNSVQPIASESERSPSVQGLYKKGCYSFDLVAESDREEDPCLHRRQLGTHLELAETRAAHMNNGPQAIKS
jgi:hypothetical protein